MKRFIFTATAVTVAGVASAQSSVTLFGVVDIGVSSYKSQSQTPLGVSVTASKNAMSNSGYTTSRLGFRGTEDLGGGLGASFWLEAGLNPASGTLQATGGGLDFNRRSTVSLTGAFGELRIGRDYTPSYWNDTVFDPLGNNGVGTNLITNANLGVPNSGFLPNPNYVRASNSVGYFLPPGLGGLYGQAMYAFSGATTYDPGTLTPPGAAAVAANPALAKTPDNARAGAYIGGRVGYTNGALNVALGYAQSTLASNYYAGSTTTLDTLNMGATYDFGVLKLFGEYSNNKQKIDLATNTFNPFGTTKSGFNGGLLGITVPIGASLIRAGFSTVRYNNLPVNILESQPKANQYAISYVYNLSKRTAVYTTFAYISDKNGAGLGILGAPTFFTGVIPGGVGSAVPNKSMGVDFGISHVF